MALKMQQRRAAVKSGAVEEIIPEFKRQSMKLVDDAAERPLFDKNGNLDKEAVLATASKYKGLDKGTRVGNFEVTTPPR